MNWGEGFRRVGLVTATIYWVAALSLIGMLAYDDLTSEYASPFGPKLTTYTFDWPDAGSATVLAPSLDKAQEIVNDHYAYDKPPPTGATEAVSSAYSQRKTFVGFTVWLGQMLGVAVIVYAILALFFRGLGWIGRGFITSAR